MNIVEIQILQSTYFKNMFNYTKEVQIISIKIFQQLPGYWVFKSVFFHSEQTINMQYLLAHATITDMSDMMVLKYSSVIKIINEHVHCKMFFQDEDNNLVLKFNQKYMQIHSKNIVNKKSKSNSN